MSITTTSPKAEIVPEVGMGATCHYPQDSYGYVIVRVSPSGKTAWLKRLKTVDKTTGHKPAYFNGPFPVWSHEYTEEEMQSMQQGDDHALVKITKRRNGRGWIFGGIPFSVGSARYHRDYSY